MLCPDLRVLLIGEDIPLPDRVLQTLSKFCVKLQVAFLIDNHFEDRFKPETLNALQLAVCKENRDLEDFYVVAEEADIPGLQQAAPLFTYSSEYDHPPIPHRFSLCHLSMRRFLGLEF